MTERAPQIQRTEVDGVPVFVGSYAPPLGVGIVFRVGRVDESLATSGITHLVEHLALSDQLGRRHEADGWVQEVFAGFYVEGEPSHVVNGMQEICRALSNPPVERLNHERRILQVEGAGSGSAALTDAFDSWFGPSGYGLMGSRELGLDNVTEAQVTTWAHERFTSGNAAAWATGPIPDRFNLSLPPGRGWSAPPWKPIVRTLPAEAIGESSGVSVSFPIERGSAASVVADVAEAALLRRLRTELGLTYHVDRQVRDLDDRTLFTLLHADCRTEDAARVRNEMLIVLRDLAAGLVSEEDMALAVAGRIRDLLEKSMHRGALLDPVGDEALGRPWQTPQDVVDELRSLRPAGIARLMGSALESALVIVPEGTEGPAPGLARYERVPLAPIEGRRLRARTFSPVPLRSRLVLAPEGLSLRYGSAEETTIRFDRIAAALRWKNGDWALVSENGDEAVLRPEHWENRELILQRLEDAIAPERIVLMDGIDPAPFERTSRVRDP